MDQLILRLENETNIIFLRNRDAGNFFQDNVLIIFLTILCGLTYSEISSNKENGKNKISQLLNNSYSHIILAITSLIVTVIFAPILFLTLAIFIGYRSTVNLILKIKYGRHFGCILKGADSMWLIEDVSKSIINILLIIETDSTFLFHKVSRDLQRKIFQNSDVFEKMLSTYGQEFGYYYTLKNQITIEDVVKRLPKVANKETLDKNDLETLLENCSNQDLPRDPTSFWEVLIGSQSIVWDEKTDKNCYPIIFRVHHSLSDGTTLLKVLSETLADYKTMESDKINMDNFFLHMSSIEKVWGNLGQIFKNICLICFAPAVILVQLIMRRQDSNILHGPQLSGKKLLLFQTEYSSKIIDKIKKMKKQFALSFSDVILTATSASFCDYYQKNALFTPKAITAVIPSMSKFRANRSIFENQFSVAMMNIPLIIESKATFRIRTPLINRMQSVKKQTEALKNSPDYQINYWILNVLSTCLPIFLLKSILNSVHSTLVISNLPGPKKLEIFNGCQLRDVLFWIPHRGTTGLGLSILSYDDRLQIGLSADTSLIYSKEDGQDILDNILRYLKELDLETQGINSK